MSTIRCRLKKEIYAVYCICGDFRGKIYALYKERYNCVSFGFC